jgi:hypothetical protein
MAHASHILSYLMIILLKGGAASCIAASVARPCGSPFPAHDSSGDGRLGLAVAHSLAGVLKRLRGIESARMRRSFMPVRRRCEASDGTDPPGASVSGQRRMLRRSLKGTSGMYIFVKYD